MPGMFSVIIGCYGDFPKYSVRAVESAVGPIPGDYAGRGYDVHVGCNEVGRETRKRMRQLLDEGAIGTLIDSNENINKDRMMRLLIDRCDSSYVVWLDDDSWFTKTDWPKAFTDFIGRAGAFDVAGHTFFCHRGGDYKDFLKKRPWYRAEPKEKIVWFATGGLWIARTDFLRRHNFPDRGMVKKQDDLLLGDCLEQAGGKLKDFGKDREIMSRVKISDGSRRGSGERGVGDGWLNVDAVTGV